MILHSATLEVKQWHRADLAACGFVLVFLIFWSAVPWLLQQEPPIDNLEQLNWALHPALGYSKHPPLPSLILWLCAQIAPAGLVMTYVLGATQVLFTLIIAYWLGTATLDRKRAWLGALLITGISYHTLRMHYYNHNTALLCANAAAMLCAWKAAHEGHWPWWTALGCCWAAGMLSKYQMALPILCNLAFLSYALRRSPRVLLRGMTLAGLVALALLMPHIVWLVQNHFPTFTYASQSLGAALPPLDRADSLLRFFASQLLRVMPAALLLAVLHGLARRQTLAVRSAPQRPPQPMAVPFWAIHAIGPLALMSMMSAVGGVDLEMHWGTAFLWALPMAYLATASGRKIMQLPRLQMLALIASGQALLMAGKLVFPTL